MSEAIPYQSPEQRRLQREITQHRRRADLLEARLQRLFHTDAPPLPELLRLVAMNTETTPEQITGRGRNRAISDVRCVFIYLAHVGYGYSKSAVARFLGRDRSTVLYLFRSFHGKIYEETFRRMVMTVRHNVAEGLKRQPTSRPTILEQ